MGVPRFPGRMGFLFGKKRSFDEFYVCGTFFWKLSYFIRYIGNKLNIGLDLDF